MKGLFLHHTAGSERGAVGMRQIQNFHMDVRGWSDIAYSWVYGPIARTFYEGRGAGVAGAHTRNHNSTAHALCVMGHFDRMAVPPTLVHDLAEFARWHRQYGPNVFTGGHRDVASTSCPGDKLYRLIPNINAAATAAPPEDDDMPLSDADIGRIWDHALLGGSSAGRRLVAIDDRTAKLLSRESAEKTAAEVGCDPEDLLNAMSRRLAE